MYQAAQWTDKQGNLWIFGGSCVFNQNQIQEQADLWEYDPLVNTWTWIKGTGLPLQPGIYGILGVPAITNMPGARAWGCCTWTDSIGDLWLIWRHRYDQNGYEGYLNDLWRYHIESNEWTWMGGASTANTQGIYGSLYQASDSSIPGARNEANTAWVDANNNLWLFGGQGYLLTRGSFNDMWRYNIGSDQWTWMGGSRQLNASGSYGILGAESPDNMPMARCSYTHWVDSSYLYLTGGGNFESGYLFSDVWRFNLITNYWTWVGGDTGNVLIGQYSHFCSTNDGDEPRGRFEQRSAQINSCFPVLFMFGGALSQEWDSV